MEKALTVQAAMDAVFAEFGAPDIDTEGGEFTVAQYCAAHDLTVQTATHHLNAAVKAGMLSVRFVVADGHRCKGFRTCAESMQK